MADTRVVITIDDEEQISLRDFGYITDEQFDDKEAIANAIHDIIADLWKMREQQEAAMRDYLLKQGIWEKEVDDVLAVLNDDSDEEDVVIVAIFDSAYDLAVNYVENVVGELDYHINAVLDYSKLGEEIAYSDEEYLLLESGRIIEFER